MTGDVDDTGRPDGGRRRQADGSGGGADIDTGSGMGNGMGNGAFAAVTLQRARRAWHLWRRPYVSTAAAAIGIAPAVSFAPQRLSSRMC